MRGAEHGFTMFEYDVKLSRDNVLVLMHDDDVDRTSNGHGPAAAKDYIELAQLDFGGWHSAAYAGEPLPTFAAVARTPSPTASPAMSRSNPPGSRGRDRPRRGAGGPRVVEAIGHRPLLSSFAEEALAAAQAAPELPRALLVEKSRPTGWRACRNTSAWR